FARVTTSSAWSSTLYLLRSAKCVGERSATKRSGSGFAKGSAFGFPASAFGPPPPALVLIARRTTNSTPPSSIVRASVSMRWSAPAASACAVVRRTCSQRSSDDFEIPLQLPIGHGVEPLAPLPLARRGEVVDEVR